MIEKNTFILLKVSLLAPRVRLSDCRLPSVSLVAHGPFSCACAGPLNFVSSIVINDSVCESFAWPS